MKKFILILNFITLLFNGAYSQTSSIKGIVISKQNKKPLGNVDVLVFKSESYLQTATTDSTGKFEIAALEPGTYSIAIRYPNFVKFKKDNINLKANETLKLDSIQLISFIRPQYNYDYGDNVYDQDKYRSSSVSRGRSTQRVGKTGGAPHVKQYKYTPPTTVVYQKTLSKPSENGRARPEANSPKPARLNERVGTTAVKYERRELEDAKVVTSEVLDSVSTVNAPPEEVIGAEEYDEIIESPFKPTHKNLLSTFSIDVDKASYSNMRRYLKQNQLPPKNVIRTEELLNYFSYNYPQPKDDKPFSISTEMSDCPWNKNHKLVHIGIQGKIIPMDNIPAMNLVFLVDVSGSMQTPNKLPLVIESLKMLTAQLRPMDKICIITYAGADAVVLAPTSGSDKTKIYIALQNLQAGGGTNGSAGIKRAYEEAVNNFVVNGTNRVILCTDGDFNIGISNNDELQKLIEEKRKTGVFLSVLGFGMGNYKDNRMEMLADKGNGNYAYIDKLEEAKKVFVHEIGGTLYTIAKDVKIQMEFNPMFVKEYRLIGYENRILKNEDFANDAIDAGDLGSGHNVTALYEIVPNLDKTETGVLKYDASDITPSKLEGNEWLFVKMRYKNPNDSVSKLLIHKLDDKMTNNPTANFYFSAAVVEYAMLMHNSLYKGTASFSEVKSLATKYAENDSLGYKKEFIELVKIAEQLSSTAKAGK